MQAAFSWVVLMSVSLAAKADPRPPPKKVIPQGLACVEPTNRRNPRLFELRDDLIYRALIFGVATAVPHLGIVVRSDSGVTSAQMMISWPLSIAFGPVASCTFLPTTRGIRDDLANHRLLIEPYLWTADRRGDSSYGMRPGYRFVHHQPNALFGLGAGLGTNLKIVRESFRASAGCEAVFRFGRCCAPGYAVLALRYDRYFAGDGRDMFSATLGFEYY
jgi:hypothetical protein